MADANYKTCAYFLIRIAPDPIRNEHVNIGVALYESPGAYVGVKCNPDLRRARLLFPQFEEADLQGLERELADQLGRPAAEPWRSRDYLLRLAAESFSHSLQLTPPTLVLTRDPAAELELLYRRYAAPFPEPAGRSAGFGARRAILAHLRQVFTEERVWSRLGRNIPAAGLSGEPDAFRFDFHYQPGPIHHCIQAVPLGGDDGPIKELCFTAGRVRDRLQERGLGFDLAAFGALPDRADNPRVEYQRGLLENVGCRALGLADAAAEAARIRAALGIA